jgi:hypothetical protein
MSPLRDSDRLPTFEKFLEGLKPERLWKRIQDGEELKFPPELGCVGCLTELVGWHIWLVLLGAGLGAIILDWQKFGLDWTRLLPELGALIFLALVAWHMFVVDKYQLVLRISGADIIAEERVVKVCKNTIRLKDCRDAVPASKGPAHGSGLGLGGIIISSKNGEQLLIGKHLDSQYSVIVADFFKFIIGQMQSGSTEAISSKNSNEGLDTQKSG